MITVKSQDEIKLLEIIGEPISKDLSSDLKNVTSSEVIEFVEEFSTKQQVLKSENAEINITFSTTLS